MIEIFTGDREHEHHIEISPRTFLEEVIKAGGDMDTLVEIDSDGEPLYFNCYPGTGVSDGK